MNTWINGVSDHQAAEEGESQPRQPFYIFTFTACLMGRFPLLDLERAAVWSRGGKRQQGKDICGPSYTFYKPSSRCILMNNNC